MNEMITSQPASGSPEVPETSPTLGPTLGVLRRAIFYVSLPFGILAFLLPLRGKQIGADAVQIGLFFTVFFIMLVILRPLVGVGLDRFGRRPFFLSGVLGYALTMIAFAFAGQIWVILLARILQGIASSLLWLSAQAITADSAGDQERGRAFGAISMASSQGSILGVFIGFTVLFSLSLQDGWQPLFIGYALVILAAGLLTWSRLPETRRASGGTSSPPIPWTRNWNLLLLVTTVTGAAATMLAPVIMIYLQDRLTADITVIAWASLPAALVTALLTAKLGSLADRYGRKPFMILGLAVAAGTSFLFPWIAGSLVALAVFWAVESLCFAAGDPAEQALVADLTGDDQRGKAYGLYAMAGGLGAAVGPLVGGWLYQAVDPAAPFIANGLVLAACALVLGIFLQEPARQTVEGSCLNQT